MRDPDTSRRRFWLWTLGEVLVVTVLALNALDLASDSWPQLRNEAFPLRPPEEERAQFFLLASFFVWCGARAPSMWRALRRAPVPRVPLVVLTTVMAVELGHVAFHVEIFPFSYVGMFSFVEPAPSPEWWTDGWYVVDREGKRRPFSYFRLGDPWLAEPVSLDGRTAWIFFEHRGSEKVKERLRRALAEEGFSGPPRHERWRVRMSDGQVVERWDPRRGQTKTP